MNPPSPYRVPFRSSDFVAMVLAALGAVVIGGAYLVYKLVT